MYCLLGLFLDPNTGGNVLLPNVSNFSQTTQHNIPEDTILQRFWQFTANKKDDDADFFYIIFPQRNAMHRKKCPLACVSLLIFYLTTERWVMHALHATIKISVIPGYKLLTFLYIANFTSLNSHLWKDNIPEKCFINWHFTTKIFSLSFKATS